MLKNQKREFPPRQSFKNIPLPPRREGDIKKAILLWLNSQENTFAINIQIAGIPIIKGLKCVGFRRNQMRGCSDILGSKRSKFFAFEVKTPTGKLSDAQRDFLWAVNVRGGGYEAVVRSLEDAQEAFKEI